MVSHVPPCTSFRLQNGELLPAGGVPPSDRGFRYGQHLFETIVVREGRWGFYDEHLEVLQACAEAAGFQMQSADRATLKTAPRHPFFNQNPHNGIVRLYWTAGDGGPTDPPGMGRVYFTVEHGGLCHEPRWLRVGVWECKTEIWWNGWKTGNYWARLEILRAGRKEGLEEMLLVSPSGEIVSACMANVFVKLSGEWLTPPTKSGARAGVVRGHLLRKGFGREERIPAAALNEAEGILLCNSRLGPMPARIAKTGEVSSDGDGISSEMEELWRGFAEAAWGGETAPSPSAPS